MDAEEEEGENDDDDEEDEEEEEECVLSSSRVAISDTDIALCRYDDDEDLSWKTRRSAAKVIGAVVSTVRFPLLRLICPPLALC